MIYLAPKLIKVSSTHQKQIYLFKYTRPEGLEIVNAKVAFAGQSFGGNDGQEFVKKIIFQVDGADHGVAPV